MTPLASIFDDAASGAGFIAASIAVCGFVGHIQPVLAERGERAIRLATVIGGICGLVVSALVCLRTLVM